MQLDVGDSVVYGSHGIGRIVSRPACRPSPSDGEVVVIELGDGLTVILPIDRAQEQLRAPASRADMLRVRATLRETPEVSREPWLTRRRAALAKLAVGDALGLAEILRDGSARERVVAANGGRAHLSPGERDIFTRARRLLSTEVAHVLGLRATDAGQWIDEQLALG